MSLLISSLFWSPVTPLTLPIGFCGCLVHYAINKMLIVRMCQPQLFSSKQLTLVCLDQLKWICLGWSALFFFTMDNLEESYSVSSDRVTIHFLSLVGVMLCNFANKHRIMEETIGEKLDGRAL